MIDSFEYLVVKDPHFMFGFRNNVRKHGWEQAIDNKISQIIEYACSNNIKNIFFTGDVFEKSKKKDWSFNQLQQNKSRLLRFKNAGLDVYSNIGNHDYFDGSESTSDTVFGEMMDLGLLHYIGTGMAPVEFKTAAGNHTCSLFGIDHHQDIDIIISDLDRIQNTPAEVRIVLMHSNITDAKTRITDFTYDYLSAFDIDIINCGHWHLEPQGGSIQDLNDTYFLNPWNLTRVMRDYNVKLDEHKPSFIHASVVFVGDQPEFNFKEVQLVVEPFSEAFNVDVIDILQELGKSNFKFFEDQSLDPDEELNDDQSLIIKIAEQYNIGERSVKIVKDLLC